MTRHAADGPSRRRKRLGPGRVVLVAVLSAVAIAASIWTVSTYLAQLDQPKDMRGNPVLLPALSKEVREKTDAISSVGIRLKVPATKLDVPIGAINEVNGVMDPPGFASAYLVRNYGANLGHASNGTVFVVMHSCRGGAVCPGNYLISVAAGRAAVPTGADVYLDELHYRVTGWQKVDKPKVGSDAAIWDNTPGRLVLLTCLQNPEQTASTQNMVVTAQLVEDSAQSAR